MIPLIPGARLELQGTCNRCGLCCTAEHDGQRVVCEYLMADVGQPAAWQVKALGTPEASRCKIYEYRTTLRPIQIRMLDATGAVKRTAQCFKDTWQEDSVIAERGIGRGCSLTIPVTEGQLVSFQPERR